MDRQKVRDYMSKKMTVSSQRAADSHDLIRVQGARVNTLKDVSVEIPKRRLTLFTGVSGSGKSSLVFGTIAAESQRMINETYSAFVQGLMPTLDRPEVDVLEGLTTAILVDLLEPLRTAFAKANGVKPALFSANSARPRPWCGPRRRKSRLRRHSGRPGQSEDADRQAPR
jgi:energy-coupling factor transporter ATP-binding protein EcfA2